METFERNQARLGAQEVYLNRVVEEAAQVGSQSVAIRVETEKHEALLTDIRAGSARIEGRMRRVNRKLAGMVHSQSVYSLYLVIAVELAAIVLIIVF